MPRGCNLTAGARVAVSRNCSLSDAGSPGFACGTRAELPHVPWRVCDVRLVCPTCGDACPGYDRRAWAWRHLDTMQYRTLVRAEVPQMRCEEHGVQQVQVPEADAQSRFTALFEAMVIGWLKVASFAAPTRPYRLSWDQASGIQERAVRRRLLRRAVAAAPAVGVAHRRVTASSAAAASCPATAVPSRRLGLPARHGSTPPGQGRGTRRHRSRHLFGAHLQDRLDRRTPLDVDHLVDRRSPFFSSSTSGISSCPSFATSSRALGCWPWTPRPRSCTVLLSVDHSTNTTVG